MKRMYLFIFSCIICFSCHEKNNTKTTTISGKANVEYVYGERLLLDVILHPARMAIGNDLLFVSCFSCDTMLYTFSLPEMKLLNSHGFKGTGPEDFIFPVFTDVHDSIINIWGYTDFRKIKQYYVDSFGNFLFKKEFMLEENKAYNQLFTKKDSFAFYNDFPPSLALRRVDLDSKNEKEYSFEIDQEEGYTFFNKNKGDLCVSNNGIAYLYYYKNRIDFFDFEFNLLESYIQNEDVHIDIQNWNNNVVYYVSSFSGNRYLYAINHSNKLSVKSTETQLEVFDWKGSFVRSYILKPAVDLFVVDEEHNILYGFDSENPDFICKYKL